MHWSFPPSPSKPCQRCKPDYATCGNYVVCTTGSLPHQGTIALVCSKRCWHRMNSGPDCRVCGKRAEWEEVAFPQRNVISWYARMDVENCSCALCHCEVGSSVLWTLPVSELLIICTAQWEERFSCLYCGRVLNKKDLAGLL